MATAQERFQAAVNVIKGLPKNGPYQPSPTMMLKFYGLYKQATEGACHQKKPAFWDIVNKAKWDAWNKNSHLSKEQAMQNYVEGLQEIIETMSFTENVQDFVGSLQGLENITLDELGMIAPRMRELAESHPNSPFNSRTNSPQRQSNNINGDESLSNGHISSSDEVENNTPPTTPNDEPHDELQSQSQPQLSSSNNNPAETETNFINYSQLNGSIDQSDDEYADPFDIQNELNESLLQNTEILKQVHATVLRMNADMSSVNQRVLDMEKTIKDLKSEVKKSKTSSAPTTAIIEHGRVYPKWWPFSNISPGWFVLLVLWPFIARRVGKMLAQPPKRH